MHAIHHSPRKNCSVWTMLTTLLIISLLVVGCTPQKAKVYHVGVLSGIPIAKNITDGMKSKLTELGYEEGKTIVYDVQETGVDVPAYQKILQKFIDDKVDVIVAFPTEATMEAKAITQGTNIPVVFAFVQIEGIDLVDSVRAPGGNITGVRLPGPDVAVKRFELLRQIAPEAMRFYVPYLKGYPIVPAQLEALRTAANEAGVTLIEAPIAGPAAVEADLQTHVAAGVVDFDAILTLVEPLYSNANAFPVFAKFAYDHKIPIGGGYIKMGDYSSIFGIGWDTEKMGQQVGQQVDKILKGANAGTLPLLSAENYIQMDTKAAQQIGVTIPESLLMQANQVIR